MSGMHRPAQSAPGAPGAQKPPPSASFNSMAVPANYVPGLGRGATGFTTRSDIGPARMTPEMAAAQQGAPGAPPAAPAPAAPPKDENKPETNDAEDDSKFDHFMGNDAGALAGTFGEYDQDDREADEVWEAIDAHMDDRRRAIREKKLKEDIEKYRKENPKITEQFADLKRKLAQISEDEWNAIPDIGDYTRHKKNKMEILTPAPDNLLAQRLAEKQSMTSISAGNGLDTPAGMNTNLKAIGEGRTQMLDVNLENIAKRMGDSASGKSTVDPKGYLTSLDSIQLSSDAEIGDIKKARMLLKSVINTNPKHAPGWVAAARLEETVGAMPEARKLIMKGCDLCPSNEDVWLEAARMQTPDNAKALLARGVQHNQTSVKLWIQAARLEQDAQAKSRVLRRALEKVPTSVRLWKAAIELAGEDDARVLLKRATECCPQHVELWLALARLESYENARKILNEARRALPSEMAIWIHAAKLEEANGNTPMVGKIIERALKSLSDNQVIINRDVWLKEAEAAERADPPMVSTCREIVRTVVDYGVEKDDWKKTWKADAQDCLDRGSVETARAILQHAIAVFPGKKSLYRALAHLERQHGTPEAVAEVLERGVKYCPQAEILWLMAAKTKWQDSEAKKQEAEAARKAGDETRAAQLSQQSRELLEAARGILNSANVSNPESEQIWLAAFKIEFENNEMERARRILEKARSTLANERIWMKSALVERERGQTEEELKLLMEGISKFPYFHKLYLMLGQLNERQGRVDAARAAYQDGLKRCMASAPLWRALSRLEEGAGLVGKARNVLEQARLKNQHTAELWLAAVRVEQRAGNIKAAESLMARALSDCPKSGVLLAENLAMAPRPARKAKSLDALKECPDDPHVVAAVAQLIFWSDRKVDKARSWLHRAVKLARGDNGDFWALLYKLESQYGNAESQAQVLGEMKKAEPHHGERWQRVSKDPQNAHASLETTLKKVILDIDNQPAP